MDKDNEKKKDNEDNEKKRIMRKDNEKKNHYNLVIYTIQTITILSQQNKTDIETFKVHNI